MNHRCAQFNVWTLVFATLVITWPNIGWSQGQDEVNALAWEELIGKWTFEKLVFGDERATPKDEIANWKMTIEREEMILVMDDDDKQRIAFKIDATHEPTQFKMLSDEQKTKLVGILKIKDGRLTLRAVEMELDQDENSDALPKDFESELEGEMAEIVLKRVK